MAIAEFERSIIQARVAAGLRAAKAKGVKLGRPATLDEYEPKVRVLIRPVEVNKAQSELEVIGQQVESRHPVSNAGIRWKPPRADTTWASLSLA